VYEYILEGKKRKKNKAHELKPKFLARLPNILKKKNRAAICMYTYTAERKMVPMWG
jgi:hypothetical protein